MDGEEQEAKSRSWLQKHGGNIFGASILALFALLIVLMRVLGGS
jgi:hypothetical protein